MKDDFLGCLFYHGAIKGACSAPGTTWRKETHFLLSFCVAMCVRMHLVSASVHNAPGEPAAPGLFMVEVVLLDGSTLSGLSVCRNNADRIPAVGVNSGLALPIN